MKGSTLALAIGLPVVLGGGGVVAFLLLRKKPLPQQQAMDMGAAQALYGSKAVAEMAPPGAAGAAVPTPKVHGTGTLADPRIMQGAASVVGAIYPGLAPVAKTAASIVTSIDQKVGTGLFKKIPGIGSIGSKLKLW